VTNFDVSLLKLHVGFIDMNTVLGSVLIFNVYAGQIV
jgi:hypothetical protein